MLGGAPFSEADTKKMNNALEWTNGFIKETGYFAPTQHATIADYSLMGTLSTYIVAEDLIGVELSKYPELMQWVEKMKKELRNYEKSCGDGANQLGEFIHNKWKK